MTIQLTQDQQDAYAAIITLVTTNQQTLVITGAAGCGKTTLMNTFIQEWPQLVALSAGAFNDVDVVLTATTNKAADALANATKRETVTIHSLLGLRVVSSGYGRTKLVDTNKVIVDGLVVVIDEASFIDQELLARIEHKLRKCKVIFLGDPHQLKPVGSSTTPVFNRGYPTVSLNQIVRQADDSPIQTLSRGLRSLVEGHPMPNAGVDGTNIIHMPQQDFEAAFVQDVLNNPVNSVRALAWTNKKAIHYNHLVSIARNGSADIHLGDVVNVNKQHRVSRNFRFPTDSTFQVMGLGPWREDQFGLISREVETSFGPRYLNLTNKVINTQFEVIRKMAEHSCVIIGRCSDYILQERDNVTNIYIYAPEDVRIRTVMEQEDLSESKARQIVKDMDVFLHRRYKYITGTYRSDRHNRHLLIDSSVLGWDRTAKYLQAFIEMKYEG